MTTRTLNFNLSDMSLADLAHLLDALETASNVLSGLQEQPRFWNTASRYYSKAGQHLEEARVALDWEMDAIRERAAKMAPEDDRAAGYKFSILASTYSGMTDAPSEVVRRFAGISADIECELQRQRDKARAA